MAQQIPLDDLIKGKWYAGRGRRGNVGLWDGKHFLTISKKFDEDIIKYEPYYTDETGTFQPFALVDEGVMVEPFGRLAWDAHHGRRMEFGWPTRNAHAAQVLQRELVGTWMASTYLPDGRRIDINQALNSDGTYISRTQTQTQQGSREDLDHGSWQLQWENEFIQIRICRDEKVEKETIWHILEFTGKTLLVCRHEFPSRDPLLYYRVQPQNPVPDQA